MVCDQPEGDLLLGLNGKRLGVLQRQVVDLFAHLEGPLQMAHGYWFGLPQ